MRSFFSNRPINFRTESESISPEVTRRWPGFSARPMTCEAASGAAVRMVLLSGSTLFSFVSDLAEALAQKAFPRFAPRNFAGGALHDPSPWNDGDVACRCADCGKD